MYHVCFIPNTFLRVCSSCGGHSIDSIYKLRIYLHLHSIAVQLHHIKGESITYGVRTASFSVVATARNDKTNNEDDGDKI